MSILRGLYHEHQNRRLLQKPLIPKINAAAEFEDTFTLRINRKITFHFICGHFIAKNNDNVLYCFRNTDIRRLSAFAAKE